MTLPNSLRTYQLSLYYDFKLLSDDKTGMFTTTTTTTTTYNSNNLIIIVDKNRRVILQSFHILHISVIMKVVTFIHSLQCLYNFSLVQFYITKICAIIAEFCFRS